MSIDYGDVFDVLVEAMPECPPDPGDLEDRLSYLYINQLARYVCNRADLDYEPLLKRFGALIERLFVGGDETVQGLAYEALQTVWEHHEENGLVARYFGSKTIENWLQLCGGAHPQ